MVCRILILSLLSALACFPQSLPDLLDQAPPDVDQALRTAVTKFYQAHVEGKFRAADEVVAEDSKDVFFAAEKRRCRSFEIVKLKYSDNFTRATSVVACDTEMLMPMGGRFSVKMPLTSFWKLEGSRWWWFTPPLNTKGQESPFGILSADAAGTAPAGGGLPAQPVDLKAISNLVKADKRVIRLGLSTDREGRVVVTNQMPGAVSLSLDYWELPGLAVKLDRTNLTSGESATVSVGFDFAKGRPPAMATLRVIVTPTQQIIPIEIQFELPAAK